MAGKVAYRKKRQNRFGMFLVSIVVIMLLIVVAVKSSELQTKKEQYVQKEMDLEKQIEDEKKRTEEIKEYETYTQTKKFIEEEAKDKLGLVYEDEIIFKDENK